MPTDRYRQIQTLSAYVGTQMGELVICSPILKTRLTPLLFKSSWLKAKRDFIFLLIFINNKAPDKSDLGAEVGRQHVTRSSVIGQEGPRVPVRPPLLKPRCTHFLALWPEPHFPHLHNIEQRCPHTRELLRKANRNSASRRPVNCRVPYE